MLFRSYTFSATSVASLHPVVNFPAPHSKFSPGSFSSASPSSLATPSSREHTRPSSALSATHPNSSFLLLSRNAAGFPLYDLCSLFPFFSLYTLLTRSETKRVKETDIFFKRNYFIFQVERKQLYFSNILNSMNKVVPGRFRSDLTFL